MATWANGYLRLDFSPARRSSGLDAGGARYRCPCRDCAFSREEERGEGAPAEPVQPGGGWIPTFERQLDGSFA